MSRWYIWEWFFLSSRISRKVLSMDAPFSLSQNDDILPAVSVTEAFAYRYAYARSEDSRKYGDPGQDFLCFQITASSFMFSLCDGVSQSFFGDLASRLLGNALIKWLGSIPPGWDKTQSQEELSRYLLMLSIEADNLVQNYTLPDSISPLLRGVLEEKRIKGSETTFVTGRIDLPGKDYPCGRFIAAWLGDSRLRLWNGDTENSQALGGKFQTSQRWSSKHGAVDGMPHLFLSPLYEDNGKNILTRWQLYSDGLASLDKIVPIISNNQLREAIIHSAHTPQSDDISYLEIWLGKLPENVSLDNNPVSLESPTVFLDLDQPDLNSAKTVLMGNNFSAGTPLNEKFEVNNEQSTADLNSDNNSPTTPIIRDNGQLHKSTNHSNE